MDACCLTFIITKNQKVGGGQKSASPKGPFFKMICDISAFLSRTNLISSPPQRQQLGTCPFLYTFQFFSLRPHPPQIQKGGHTIHACSFSYGATPNSGPKGGHVPKLTPLIHRCGVSVGLQLSPFLAGYMCLWKKMES